MTVFAGAVDVLFADPNLSLAATFTPQVGTAKTVRVIWGKPDEVWHGLQTGTVAPERIADVRVSDITAPAEGDSLAIAGTTYTIDGVPRKDTEGLVWRLGLKA